MHPHRVDSYKYRVAVEKLDDTKFSMNEPNAMKIFIKLKNLCLSPVLFIMQFPEVSIT